MTRVSVVLPYHDRADVLEEAARSVLLQTHRDLRLYLVDDGSTDGSGHVARAIDDSRIVHMSLGGNQGACVARNAGLDASSDSLVALMDSDDTWRPTKLQCQIQYLRAAQAADAKVAVAGCGWTNYGAARPSKSFAPGPFCRRDVLKNSVAGIGTPMLLVDRDVTGQVGFDPDMPALQDRDFVVHCLSGGRRVVVVPEILAAVRRGRSDHVAAPRRAAAGYERMLDKYNDELGDDLRSWYAYSASREYLSCGEVKQARRLLRIALSDRRIRRSVHLGSALLGRRSGLAAAQRLLPMR